MSRKSGKASLRKCHFTLSLDRWKDWPSEEGQEEHSGQRGGHVQLAEIGWCWRNQKNRGWLGTNRLEGVKRGGATRPHLVSL